MKIKEILGNGTIECQTKGSYRLRFTVKYTNGDKERISKTVPAPNKTQARVALDTWRIELLKGISLSESKKVTVNEMLDLYLAFCRENKKLALKTLEGYRKIAERYLRPDLGNRFVDEFTPIEIEDFFSDLRRTGGSHGRPLSGATCNRIKSVLSPMFKRAIFHQYIEHNPCTPITMPSSKKVEMRVLSQNEVRSMLSLLLGLPDKRLAMVVRLALFSGCRRGEICGLRWVDIDFERSTIHVRHSLAEVSKTDSPDGETTLFLKDTKTCENRNLSMDAETMKHLWDYKRQQSHQIEYRGGRQTDATPVFADVFGAWYRPSNLTKHFEAFAAQNAFSIRFHDIRHTHASILIANHMSIVDVSKRLGHAKVSTTLDIYSHMMPGQDRAIADKLDELFAPEISPEDTFSGKSSENRVLTVPYFKIIRARNQKVDRQTGDLPASLMVVGGGLEPSTRGFSVRCSTD